MAVADLTLRVEERGLRNCLGELLGEVRWWHDNPFFILGCPGDRELVDKLLKPLLDHSCEDFAEAAAKVYAYVEGCTVSVPFTKMYNISCLVEQWTLTLNRSNEIRPNTMDFIFQSSNDSSAMRMIELGNGNPFGYALRFTDLALMRALIQYDLTHKDEYAVHEYLRAAINIFKFGHTYLESQGWMKKPAFAQFVQRIVDSLCGDQSTRYRTLLLAQFLPALRETPDKDPIPEAKEYAECVKIYLRTVDQPYVTAREMEHFFKYFYGEAASVETAVECYRSLFKPDSCMPAGPKPLKQLCRCAVRRHLRHGGTRSLPSLVRDLRVPKLVKSYILCEI